MTQRLASFVFAITAASACASSKGPPPRAAEVPIDEGAGAHAGGPLAGAGATTETGGGVASAGSAGAAGGGGGGAGGGTGAAAGGGAGGGASGGSLPERLPAMLPTMTDVAPAAGATGSSPSTPKPLPPKAERLSAPECNKIMDKYIELVGLSQGIAPDSIAGVMPMLRNSVASDPNYTNALGACAKENTKTQYRCAMKAPDVDGWKRCMQ